MSEHPNAIGYALSLDDRGYHAEATELRRQHELIQEMREALRSVLDGLGALAKRRELLKFMSEAEANAVFSALAKAEEQK